MPERSLGDVAHDRYGLVTDRELDELGITEGERRRRIAAGEFERLNGKVLAVAGSPRTWSQRAAAALLAVPSGVLGYGSAARVLGLPEYRDHDEITLSVPLAAHYFIPGIEIRRTGRWSDEHVMVTDGLRHTTLGRTLVDLALVTPDRRLQDVIEEAVSSQRITWDELEATYRSLAGQGRSGTAGARRVLEAVEGRPPSEAELERMYTELLQRAGVPVPTMRMTPPWAERQPGRVDAMYEDAMAIVELDGRRFRVRHAALTEDARRDRLAREHGYDTVRFTHLQLRNDPDHVVEVSRTFSART